MDKTDLKIIEELTDDSRKPFKKIAEKIGVSTQTVINRYNKMVSQKIIRSNSISINLKKIGYIGTVHLFLEIPASTNPSQVISKVKKMKNVIIASKTRGDYEGYVVSVVRNVPEMYEQILKIKNIKGITNIEFFITVHGIEYFPKPNIIQNKQNSLE